MSTYALTLGRAFRGGAMTGLAAGFASLAAGLATLAVTGWTIEVVPLPAMFIAAFVLTMVGTPVYWLIARHGRRDPLWWGLCAAVVILYSIATAFNPEIKATPNALVLVTILHLVAGLVVAFLLPRFATPKGSPTP